MRIGDGEPRPLEAVRGDLSLADRWILSRLSQVTTKTTDLLERWQLGEAGPLEVHASGEPAKADVVLREAAG